MDARSRVRDSRESVLILCIVYIFIASNSFFYLAYPHKQLSIPDAKKYRLFDKRVRERVSGDHAQGREVKVISAVRFKTPKSERADDIKLQAFWIRKVCFNTLMFQDGLIQKLSSLILNDCSSSTITTFKTCCIHSDLSRSLLNGFPR